MNAHTLKTLAGPIAILLLLTLTALLARPYTPIDETRYLSVAWEMWLKGDYLVLFKNGELYSHKPPLLFWLYNLGWAVFGVNDWWPRLVSPLFSLGGLLLTLTIARRLWPDERETQRYALWILSASLLWMVFSTLAMFDVMLAFFVLLGMRGLLIAADESRRRGFAWLALAVGMGALAKGPVILLHLLPAAMLAPWWAGRAGIDWKRWYGGILLAVAAGALIALAWAVPAAIQGGEEYRRAIFWGQTANRVVDSFAHKRPFWWYLPILPVALSPWLLWPALWRRFAALRREGLDRGLRFCLAWMAPVFVAFSFISGKQVHYLVPLIPAFALLAGRLSQPGMKGGLWMPALAAALLGGAMIVYALPAMQGVTGLPEAFSWWPGALLIVAAGLAVWAGKATRRPLYPLALLSGAVLVLAQVYFSANAWKGYDVHPMARAIKAVQDKGMPVANLGKYHAQFQFAGRLGQPLRQLSPAELPEWLERNPQGAVVVYVKRGQKLPEALFTQAYRGSSVVLMSAGQARRQLGLLYDGGEKALSLPGEGEE